MVKGVYRHENRKHLPLPQGPYPVGCVDIMTEYSSQGCLMRLYYPSGQEVCDKDRAMQWPLWIPMREYLNGYAKFLGIWSLLFKLLFRIIVGDVYIPAVWKAKPMTGMTFPLVIFSHGLGGCRTAYSTVCIELASHGFIVAAVEHRDHTACLSFYLKDVGNHQYVTDDSDNKISSGGTFLSRDSSAVKMIHEWVLFHKIPQQQKTYPIRNRQVYHRSAECIKALNVLLDLNRGEFINNLIDANFSCSSFHGIIDASRVAMVGHSFGGATIIPTLSSDKRFKVGVLLDAWMYPVRKEDGLFHSVVQPMLFVNMDKFQTNENISVMKCLASENADRRIVTIRGTVHQNCADTPFLAGRLLRFVFGARSEIDRYLAMDLINRLTLDFLWKHLDISYDSKYTTVLEKHKDILIEESLVY